MSFALRPRRLATLLAATVVAALGVSVGSASADVTLDWSTPNVYDTKAPSDTNRTWLGYSTNAPPPAGANGTVTPTAGATITDPDGNDAASITPASARGVDALYTFSYPAASGLLDADRLGGAMEFDGTISFVAPPFPNGHGFTITVEQPRIVLDGAGGGQLFASGTSGGGTYTDASPVFDLDLSRSTWNLYADGTRTLSCIVPKIATAGLVFPADAYPAGAGPNRTPNIFGSFALRVTDGAAGAAPRPSGGCGPPHLGPQTGPQGPAGADGAVGPIGPKGDAGATGSRGKTGKHGARGKRGPAGKLKKVRVSKLAKAPFAGKAAHKVRLTRNGKVVATGTVKGRALRAKSAKGLAGVYTLRASAKASTFAAVRVRVL